jgi:hypothetical protein
MRLGGLPNRRLSTPGYSPSLSSGRTYAPVARRQHGASAATLTIRTMQLSGGLEILVQMRVVVVGSGLVRASAAYHLTKADVP